MNRLFWILIGIEMTILVVLFVQGYDSPSNSGGREMALFFQVFLPAVGLVIAALMFALSGSQIVKMVAMLIALSPVLGISYAWTYNSYINHRVTLGTIGSFRGRGQQELAQAIVRQNVGKVKEMARTAKLNERSTDDLTLLSLALRENTPATLPVVQALLNAGADPNLASEGGWSIPLTRAMSSRQTEVVKALLDHGADPNARNAYGSLSFHEALTYLDDTYLNYLIQLLDRGAKIDAADDRKATALMIAAIHGNARAMNVLLDRGADRKPVDSDGKTALDRLESKMGESSPQPNMLELKAVAGRLRLIPEPASRRHGQQ